MAKPHLALKIAAAVLAAGAAVAELMARGETNLPVAGLAPGRFAQLQAA